ncbi:MAG TPA: PLP-dependent aminotransferase family protein [Polyangiaceae bacterium]
MDARIDRLQRAAAASQRVVGLGGGLPAADLFPRRELASAFLAVVYEPTCSALQYGWPEGDPDLRSWIATRLRARGALVEAGDVIVTSGAQQAVGIAVDRLVARGLRVGLDRETYPAALDLFRAKGGRGAMDAERPDWFYVMPGVTNPAGTGMRPERRAEILASGAPVIADEAYAELRFDGTVPRPLLADARDRTWHVGTLSKTLSPGLRVGWLVPPPGEFVAALEAKRARDLEAGNLSQAVVRSFLARDDFEARLAAARAYYAGRAECLVEHLRSRLPRWRFREPEGGFSVFVETDVRGDDVAFLEHATRNGVTFDPGRMFRPGGPAASVSMRLCFSRASGVELEEGVCRLERAARTFRAGSTAGARASS